MSSIERILRAFQKEIDAERSPEVEDFVSRLEDGSRRAALRTELEQCVTTGQRDVAANKQWALSSSQHQEPTEIGRGKVRNNTSVPAPPCVDLPSVISLPNVIGRYEILRTLGHGGFGVVYLARDMDLDRQVAIKVPRPDRFASDRKLASFVEEARKTAQFDHRGIVRVYDVQREPGRVYIVEQFIDGADLATFVKSNPLTAREVARLMIDIAEAVGYAHQREYVHRDLKPSNILIDDKGNPHVADFGLAVHTSVQHSLVGELAGTFPYMSPEQTRGESHRLDGRSDIWSLGVILYQLLTQRLPFEGDSREELKESINHRDPDSLHSFEPTTPTEMSRICLSCLAKRASDRFQSTDELIDDLRHWLDGRPSMISRLMETPSTHSFEISLFVEPPGLRAFEHRHADFFLQLLPPPHDREGMPKSVRFWVSRIEELDGDETFSVGLMYGPSGCGKSSIVKAGILPRLSRNVLSIVVEASRTDTVSRIKDGLRKRCAELRGELSLAAMLGQLRDAGGSGGRKVLIVLDQFEQCLHTPEEQELLAVALRQSDGTGVQVLILVRDDFFVSLNRFFNRLEVPIVEGQNAALVDLFDAEHACRVLMAFGKAYGTVPSLPAMQRSKQQRFVQRAIDGLAEDGKVACVRIAIFAELMKSRSWNEKSLREVGGIDGVGFTFLQEQFSKKTSPPLHRLHENAIREVLKELIVDDTDQLKGPTRSYEQLLQCSGYSQSPADFDTLLQILDRDLRLITPVEPITPAGSITPVEPFTPADSITRAGSDAPADSIDSEGVSQDQPTDKDPQDSSLQPVVRYQLAHDYLVHSVRDWLTQKQMETRRGRAELQLAERDRVLATNPERRHLPSAVECLRISMLTDRQAWTSRQRSMMKKARILHLSRAAVLVCLLVVVAWSGYVWTEKSRARDLMGQLLLVNVESVPKVIAELNSCYWAEQVLTDRLMNEPSTDYLQRLRLRLALLSHDPNQTVAIQDALLHSETPYRFIPLLRDVLLGRGRMLESEEFATHLRKNVFELSGMGVEQRFRAGLVLASVDTSPESWTDRQRLFLSQQLVAANSEQQAVLRDCLRPIKRLLNPSLLTLLSDTDLSESQRLAAARALADFCRDDAVRLAEALSVAMPAHFEILYEPYEKFHLNSESGRATLLGLADQQPKGSPQDRVRMGEQRSGAAIALLRQNSKEAVPMVLHVKDDPESLTQFAHGAKVRGITSTQLLDCIGPYAVVPQLRSKEQENVLFGLLLALGEFEFTEIPAERQSRFVESLARMYEFHPSSAVHGASGWLLRRWSMNDLASQVDHKPVDYELGREWYTLKITTSPESWSKKDSETLYMTFIVFEEGIYRMGSVQKEVGRKPLERRGEVHIPRRFAILDRELTRREIIAWENVSAGYKYPKMTPDHPFAGMSWYDAVRYCRWLGTQAGLDESDQPYPNEGGLTEKQYPRDPARKAKNAPRDWPVFRERVGFRLPTEAEWEAACRAGSHRAWSYGNDLRWLDLYSCYTSNNFELGLPRMKRPNLRGLFDVHGNLAEWCHDWHVPYAKSDGAREDTGGPSVGEVRVIRGGSTKDGSVANRSAARGFYVPSRRPVDFGLRIVTTPIPK